MDYAVMTVVKVRPGEIDEVADLFRRVNPALVADQPEWRRARLLANREEGTITVIAVWSDPDAYRRFAAGPLQQAMADFMPYFEGPPLVSVHEILVEM